MTRIKKLTTRELCMVAMLVAITTVLSYISGYLRIGNAIKFSVSFVSVYVAAAAFGPVIGGFVGIAADILSHLFNPIGAYLWQLGIIEFVYGALFGVFFYVRHPGKKPVWKKVATVGLCVAFQFVVNAVLKTYILMGAGYMPADFGAAFYIRLPAAIVMAVIQFIALAVLENLLPLFLKGIRGKQ